ncbi:MAG: membrane protein insertase YidC [Pseudomonadota bacterium]
MDNVRLILFFALGLVSLSLYQAWQQDYPVTTTSQATPPAAGDASTVPAPSTTASSADQGDVPLATPAVPAPAPLQGDEKQGDIVRITTDVLDLKIDSRGGSIVESNLMTMPVAVENPEEKIRLLTREPSRYFVAQSGLIGASAELAPKHDKAIYQFEKSDYKLADGEDALRVTLKWATGTGVEVSKHYSLERGSYKIGVEHEVTNNSQDVWAGRSYQQLQRVNYDEEAGAFMMFYMGGGYYTDEKKFTKYDYDDMAESKLDVDTAGGWITMMQHYFAGVWVPAQDQKNHLYSKALGNDRYMIGSYSPSITLQPGENHRFQSALFIGPKLDTQLQTTAEGLELVRDYGWLAFLAKPMFWVLQKIHGVVGNWGWAIILFTILLKIAFYKLSETSYRSMANMRKMTPRIQALKDRYGDDKQRMQQAMMELYKTEKINPLGGCLPMLVQMPFFIALYWVLMESVELRQAPWALWIQDLSTKDPYFILPLVMGISMFVQQKLNPAPPDPMQAKMMQMLPIVFTFFFAFFPAGLVLYWVVNNLLSIAQQYVITKKIENAT